MELAADANARRRTSDERPRGCCDPDVWQINSRYLAQTHCFAVIPCLLLGCSRQTRKGGCFVLVVSMGALVCICIPWPLSAGQEVVVRVRVESLPSELCNLQGARNGSGTTADEAEVEPGGAQTESAAREASLAHDAHRAEVSRGVTNMPRVTRTLPVKQPPPLPPTMLRTILEPSVRSHQTLSRAAPAGGTVEASISSHAAAAAADSLHPSYPVDDLQELRDQQYGQTPDFDPDLFQ